MNANIQQLVAISKTTSLIVKTYAKFRWYLKKSINNMMLSLFSIFSGVYKHLDSTCLIIISRNKVYPFNMLSHPPNYSSLYSFQSIGQEKFKQYERVLNLVGQS